MGAGRGSSDDSSGLRRHRDLYDHDYFHGKTSGYPSEGYARAHPDWGPWIELLAALQPKGLLLELGCAYGYLTEAVRGSGRRAVGLDLSDYALAQHPPARPFLVQGDAQELPFADGCAHVVTLFDLLEHLPDPRACLREAVRVLHPDGLMAGATSDPLHFQRPDPTHCFERPPSFWISALEELDLAVTYRFSVTPCNFQFLAAFKGSPTAERTAAWRHDYYGSGTGFRLRQRSPGGPAPLGLVGIGGGLPGNAGELLGPLPAEPAGRTGPFHDPLLRLLLARLHHPAGPGRQLHVGRDPPRLGAEDHPGRAPPRQRGQRRTPSDLRTLPTGSAAPHPRPGDRRRALFPGGPGPGPSLRPLPALPPRGAGGFPADLGPILDVGGLLGDQDGHLATTADFFSALEMDAPVQVRTTDLRHCDHPDHAPAPAWEQPFEDASFDLVLALDVLEHLEPERRPDLLSELDRVARSFILIGAPFSTPAVERTEEELAQGLLDTRRFLEEHRTLGLPSHDLVESHFGDRPEYEVHRFPSGYLPRWRAMQVLTQHYFQLNDTTSMTALNRLYNQTCYVPDLAEPSYRTLFLISKTPLSEGQRNSLAALLPGPDSDPESPCGLSEMARHPQFPSLHQRLRELLQERDEAWLNTRFLINERQKLIRLLRREIRRLRTEVPLWKLAVLRLRDKLRRR